MNTIIQRPGIQISLFFLVALCVYSISTVALFSIPESGRDYLTSFAIPFDLMVFVPVLFYFLIVRRYNLSPLLVLPIIALGNVFVFQVAQPDNLVAVFAITVFVVVVDIVIGVRGLGRLNKAYQSARKQSDDPLKWFVVPLYDLVRNRRIAKMLSAELSINYYSLFAWRKKPLSPQGSKVFTYHKESGYLALMGVILCLIPLETVLVHMFLSQWSIEAAWIFTILSAYSGLWLLGDCRASVLRPISVSDDTLTINSGIRFSVDIPLSAIESIKTSEPDLSKNLTVNMGIMGSPNTWIIFSHDIEIETFTGSTKKMRSIGLTIDNAKSFRKAIADSISK